MAQDRLAGADMVRAAACIMVLAHHVSQRLLPDAVGALAPAVIYVQMSAFGVGAFFVLSGYLLARPFWMALDANKPMPSLRNYLLRRAARIVPGTWLALVVSFLLSFLVLGAVLDGTLVLRFFAGLLFVADFHWVTWFPVEFNPPLWSIGCEVTSYLLLPLFLWPLFKLSVFRGWWARLAWLAVVVLIVVIQFQMLRIHPGSRGRGWDHGLMGGAKLWWPNYNPVGFFAAFAVGSLAAGVQTRLAAFRGWWGDAMVVAGIATTIVSISLNYPVADAYGLAGIPYGFPVLHIGVGLVLIGTPSSVLVQRFSEARPIAYLAQVSFGVYIWHYLLMEIVRVLWNGNYVYWGMRDVGLWAAISVGIVALSYAIATLSYRYFEDPIIRWARTRERRTAALNPRAAPVT